MRQNEGIRHLQRLKGDELLISHVILYKVNVWLVD